MSLVQIRPYFLLIILALTTVLTFFIFKPFLVPLALAAIFAVVLKPVYQYLLRPMKRWPAFVALLTIFLAIVCLLIPITLLGTKVVSEARQVLVSLPTAEHGTALLQNAITYIAQATGLDISSEKIIAAVPPLFDTYTKNLLSWIVTNFGSLFSSIAQVAFSFLLFMIALFYMLRDGEHFKKVLVHLSPLADNDDDLVFNRLERAVNSVVRGNITLALIQAILSGIGLAIFGVPNPVLWGMTAGLAAFIPGVGTSLVLIPATIFLLVTSSLWSAVGLGIWAMFAVGLVDNFLGPRLVGKGANLHPLIVLFAVLGGLSLFGPAGIFLGPLSASLLLAILSIYSASSLARESA